MEGDPKEAIKIKKRNVFLIISLILICFSFVSINIVHADPIPPDPNGIDLITPISYSLRRGKHTGGSLSDLEVGGDTMDFRTRWYVAVVRLEVKFYFTPVKADFFYNDWDIEGGWWLTHYYDYRMYYTDGQWQYLNGPGGYSTTNLDSSRYVDYVWLDVWIYVAFNYYFYIDFLGVYNAP